MRLSDSRHVPIRLNHHRRTPRGTRSQSRHGIFLFLALPTIIAATLYETWNARGTFTEQDFLALALGMVVSFLVAWAVIAVFLTYVQRHTLRVFAYYRIMLGVLVLLVAR